jgi:hypothetical protein
MVYAPRPRHRLTPPPQPAPAPPGLVFPAEEAGPLIPSIRCGGRRAKRPSSPILARVHEPGVHATPVLPTWITEAHVPGYVAAQRLCPGEPRLFGTESLYGDWGGAVQLLAKDFGPTRIVHDRLAAGEPRPYRARR